MRRFLLDTGAAGDFINRRRGIFERAQRGSTRKGVRNRIITSGFAVSDPFRAYGFTVPDPFLTAAMTVTLVPQGSRKLPKYEQLTITSGLLSDTQGRPIDGGHNVVATLSKSGLVISAAGALKPAVVDALLERGAGLSVRDAARRLGAQRSRGG
jgi:hypothetical protein